MSDWIRQLPVSDGSPMIGKVRLIRELGQGGMGVVYAGWHTVLDIPVAVKFLLPDASGSRDATPRFLQEARICAAINEPGLVRVFDFDQIQAGAYLIMEYVAGRNLDEVVEIAGPMCEAEVLSLLRDLAVTLISLHQTNVIHRDLKPSNLLLRAEDGRIKLTDLGVAKVNAGSTLPLADGIFGTPFFMSPEQFRDPSHVGPASDFFSLGSTAFYLLTGEHPFRGETLVETMRKICDEPLTLDRLTQRHLTDTTIQLLTDLTAKDPDQRISSGRQLLGHLPATSVPFRTTTLAAARPERSLRRDDPASLLSEADHSPSPRIVVTNSMDATAVLGTIPRSLLICECLQNDFIAPIAPGHPLPNKLHIGRDEALRIVGADPGQGPLVRTLTACAAAEHVRVVHIRDWHDPDDPRQQAELEFFGPHCIMGSHGAQFVDVVEAFSRDRGRSAIVDATGINDFEDTPLAETLQILVDDGDRRTIPVGVIGVWTNVKIHYLLYDLKTRAGFYKLATCSKLVAAPDRIEHRNALRQLDTILGVQVFHEVDEFLEFLGVRPHTARPLQSSNDQSATLIGDVNTLFDT